MVSDHDTVLIKLESHTKITLTFFGDEKSRIFKTAGMRFESGQNGAVTDRTKWCYPHPTETIELFRPDKSMVI